MEVALGVVALVATVVVVAGLADRVGAPAPLVLTVVGLVGSYLPFVPDVELEPDLILFGLLPPLLYAAAIRTSLVDFRTNKRPILLLSVGLVVFTAVGVGLVVWWVLDVPFAAGLALGAVVAPPDAVAATSIARRTGMPRRVVTILEGESLVNDATALVTLRTAIAALGTTVTVLGVGWDFLLAAVGGVLIGVAAALLVVAVRTRVDNPVIDTTLSFLAPFVAYLPAEEVHASGVLAVVVAGLLIGHRSPAVQSAASRISERTNWRTVQFVLENAVFLLIGLQVRDVVQDVADSGDGLLRATGFSLVVLATVIVLRPLWVFPATYLSRLVPIVRASDPLPPWTVPAVVSWAGMRGVVTLAAAFVLPASTPERETLVLAALVVAGGTLLLQGSTLPWLVQRLRLPGPDPGEDALVEASVLQQVHEAGEKRLEEMTGPDDPEEVVERLRSRVRERSDAAWERLGRRSVSGETPNETYVRLRLAMLADERRQLLVIRDAGGAPAEVLQHVQVALDLEESMLDRVADEPVGDGDDITAPGGDVQCAHLHRFGVRDPDEPVDVCAACVALGERSWVHLRMCLDCGTVGCCDSSPNRHAEAHFHAERHPVMRSVEPGEAWRWCYVDRLVG